MELERLFRPLSVTEQLDGALKNTGEILGRDDTSWADYRKNITRTTSAMVAARQVIVPYFEHDDYDRNCSDLVSMIESLKDLGPSLIIPHDADIFPNFNRQKLSKSHNLTTTTRFYSIGEAVRQPCNVLVAKALSELKPGDTRVGIDFKGVHESNRAYRVFTLLDCIKAEMADTTLPENAVEVELYMDTDKIFERGAEAHVVVPSFSGNAPHKVVLRHIPVYKGTIR